MSEADQVVQDLSSVRRNGQTAVAERDQAREELACVNEQLRVVNGEVANQNRELRRENDELNALLKNAAIPVVMVDRDLAIRRMTPAAEYPFNLHPKDIGKQLTDKPARIDGALLKRLTSRVLNGSSCEQTELLDCDGEWHFLSVRPYRTGSRIEGAILTLIGFDRVREDELEYLIESIPLPVLVLSSEFRITTVSRDFLSTFGLLLPNLVNHPVEEIERNPFNLGVFRKMLARLRSGESQCEELEASQQENPGETVFTVASRRIQNTKGHQFLIVLRDITAQKGAHRMWANALLETEDALRLSRQELRNLTGRLIRAQDEERRRLSRELHDDLSQNVLALQLDMEALAKRIPANLEGEQQKLTAIRDSAEELSQNLRRIAHGLHPATLEALGLKTALRTYTEEFSRKVGIVVEFSAMNVPESVAPEVASSFYRIAQEALRNIARHMGAGSARVTLEGKDSTLTLTVRDNGPGFDRESVRGRGGLGLVSMEERARLIGAKFELDTAVGKGVAIIVSAPMTSAGQACATCGATGMQRAEGLPGEQMPVREPK